MHTNGVDQYDGVRGEVEDLGGNTRDRGGDDDDRQSGCESSR